MCAHVHISVTKWCIVGCWAYICTLGFLQQVYSYLNVQTGIQSTVPCIYRTQFSHDDVIKWKHFPHYWRICAGSSLVNCLHKGQWRGALMFSITCAWINSWVNNGELGDLRRHRGHYNVIVMRPLCLQMSSVATMLTANVDILSNFCST